MKRTNTFLLLIAMLFLNLGVFAQTQDTEFLKNNASGWVDQMQDPNGNFYQAKQAFELYWGNQDLTKPNATKGRGYKAFRRWENFMAQRTFPTGEKFDPTIATRELENYKRTHAADKAATASWTAMGPNKPSGTTPNGSYQSPGGAGRINVVAVDPTNSNIIWAGSPAGGLWKSTDGGTTWSSNFDQMGVLGVSCIAINPTNTNIMYIGTGDRDAGDTYSIGILKSTDGGNTWSTTAASFTTSQKKRCTKILMDPNNPNTLYASFNGLIYKTTDGFATVTTAYSGNTFFDLEFHPTNSSIIYASGATLFRSADAGATWTQVTSGIAATGIQRMEVAVSPAAANTVWVLAGQSSDQGFLAIYKSTDSGVTFTTLYSKTSGNLLGWNPDLTGTGGQAFYDLCIAVNPSNASEILVGGVNLYKSTNGGTSWTCNGYWLQGAGYNYIHADYHWVAYTNSTTAYVGCDGGVFKTTNNGTAWSDLSNGLQIAQVARFGVSQANSGLVVAGMQDNGTNKLSGGTWSIIYGGDGCEAICDPTNTSIIYASYVQGALYRSANGGTSWTSVKASATETGSWITPFVMHPTTNTTLYAGYNNVYKSTNSGTSWTKKGTAPGSGEIIDLKVAPSNPLYFYIIKEYWNGSAYTYTVAQTANEGTAWNTRNTGLPVTTAAPTSFAVDPTTATTAWITFGSYLAGNKVFKTTDAGATWTNVSGTLPNIPVNCIVRDKNVAGALYIGTDVGVYYKDDTMSDWVYYGQGLPNVIVKELEIYYNATTPSSNRLRAATYGRSVWETPLYSNTAPDTQAPTVPSGLASSNVTSTSATISWTAATDNVGVTGYEVYRGGVLQSTVTTTSYNATGLTAGTSYSFTVKAKDAAGNVSAASTALNVTTTAPDTQAPTAPTGLASSAITSSSVTISWTAATDNVGVTGYDVYNGAALAGSTASTSLNVTGLTANTTYSFTVKAKDAAGNVSAASTALNVTTAIASITYCASKGNSVADEWIKQVTFGTINNISNANAGYGDFTAQSTNVTQGSSYTLTVYPGWTSTAFAEGVAAWIDYNKNGVFTDAGEQVMSVAASTTTSKAVTFAIPATASTGATRMRVSMKYNAIPTSCEAFSYGEVEDYTVNISAAVADTQAPTVPGGLTSSAVTSTSCTISWTASTDNVGVTGYEVYRGGVLQSTVTTTSYNATGLTASTSYSFTVKAKDAAGNVSAASTALNVTTSAATITYCASKGTSVAYEWVDLVQLGTINKTSAANAGYADNTALSTNIGLGGAYTIYFSAGYASTAYTEYWKIYIDYNKNGVFTDAGETVVSTSSASAATLSASFTVPATATLGSTRMRVVMSDASATTSCGTFSYGEAEDYTVNITATPIAHNIFQISEEPTNEQVVRVFPNPTHEYINLNFAGANAISVEVYDMKGQLVIEEIISPEGRINVSNLPAGIYNVEVFDGQKAMFEKFVKQ